MNARLEKKLRLLAVIVTASMIGAAIYSFATTRDIAVGLLYGLLISAPLAGISLFVLEGPMRVWLGGLSFTATLMVRSAIYATIIVPILFFQLGSVIAGFARDPSNKSLWIDIAYSVACVVLVNLVLGITNIIGPRAFLNFILGRYHTPIEEKRFVLFVDIAGSTGLAERLGGVAIHRLLDRTFRLLTLSVIDYRGEVLNYVGDEVIVTWRVAAKVSERRYLDCFFAIQDRIAAKADGYRTEFGLVPNFRAGLHAGPVVISECGDSRRQVAYFGDTMNVAARLQEYCKQAGRALLVSGDLLRLVDPGRDLVVESLGPIALRGRAAAIEVFAVERRSPPPTGSHGNQVPTSSPEPSPSPA